MEKAVFSKRAYTAMCVESEDFRDTETGGIFLGYYEDEVWYIAETIFPGPSAVHKSAEYAHDFEYVNYQANCLSKLYDRELFVIGLWHSHITSAPFSSEDEKTNLKFARLNGFGALSCLVDMQKKTCRMYSVSGDGACTEIPFCVSEAAPAGYKDTAICEDGGDGNDC